MRSSSRPPIPTPGEVLRQLADESEITQQRLAKALEVSRHTVSQLVNGRRAVTADMALRLGRIFSTSAEFWLNLQRAVDLDRARGHLGNRLSRMQPLRQPIPDEVLFYEA